MARVALSNLTVGHRRRPALVDLCAEINTGVTAVLGRNGAGKTTLLETIVGMRRPMSGRFFVNDVEAEYPMSLAAARDIGYMPQSWRPIPGLTVAESVAYAAWVRGRTSADLDRLTAAALSAVGLTEDSSTKVTRLSGGARQRVGLAEALAHEPSVLILDEPTVGLDVEQRRSFRQAVQRAGHRAAVVVSTHLIDDVSAFADRVVIVGHGRLLFDGSLPELESRASSAGTDSLTSRLEAGFLRVVESPSRQ